jgi:hypothetical protein
MCVRKYPGVSKDLFYFQEQGIIFAFGTVYRSEPSINSVEYRHGDREHYLLHRPIGSNSVVSLDSFSPQNQDWIKELADEDSSISRWRAGTMT